MFLGAFDHIKYMNAVYRFCRAFGVLVIQNQFH